MRHLHELILVILLPLVLGPGCQPEPSLKKGEVPSLKLQITDVSEYQKTLFISLRYITTGAPVVFNTHSCYHGYEISINGTHFRDVGKWHYIHCGFNRSFIKTITAQVPFETPVYYKLGDITFSDIKTIRIKMTCREQPKIEVSPGKLGEIAVWTGQLVSQEYVVNK